MSKKIMVIATATGFLGCLREKGDKFDIVSEDAFASSWMQKLEGEEAKAAAEAPLPVLDYVVKHVPAGNWAVVDKDGNRASRVFKKAEGNAKDLAEQEAVRLNAGGQPVLEALPTTPPPAQASEGSEGSDPTLPDA